MTLTDVATYFLAFYAALATIAIAVTQIIKKFITSKNEDAVYSSSLISLCVSTVVGIAGMIIEYYLNSIAYTGVTVGAIPLMILLLWIGSKAGYDSVKTFLTQLKDVMTGSASVSINDLVTEIKNLIAALQTNSESGTTTTTDTTSAETATTETTTAGQ